MEVIVEPSVVSYGVGGLTDCCVMDCKLCVIDCRSDCPSYIDKCWVDL